MRDPDGLPRRLPTVLTDRVLIGFCRVSDMTIRVELDFPHRLDEQRLRDALALARVAEPVLGCRFVDRAVWPYWQRVESPPSPLAICADEATWATYRATGLDGFAGPQLEAGLWRAPDGDRLLLKVGHIAADAGGTKQALGLVAGLYRTLAREPAHRPVPNLGGARGLDQVLRRVPPRAWWSGWRAWCREIGDGLPAEGNHHVPVADAPREAWEVHSLDLDRDHVARLKELGRPADATLNDLLVAAFFRAQARLANWNGRSQLRISTTVDLRRYLPGRRAGGICNLSCFDYPNLGNDLGDTFAHTLSRVVAHTRARKADWIGLSGAMGMAVVLKRLPHVLVREFVPGLVRAGFRRGVMTDGLTNMGEIPREAATFDQPARGARLLVPPGEPPVFVPGISGYDGTLSLSLGTRPGSLGDVTGRQWLAAMAGELPA